MTSLALRTPAVPGAFATVEIAGSGLAELTCAWLLLARGHRVRLRSPEPAAGPRPLLLGGPTLDLLHSLWGRELPAHCHQLTHRQVCWGPDAGAMGRRTPQPATVVDGARLTEHLLGRLVTRHPDVLSETPGPPWWTVTAAGSTGHWTAGRRHLLAGEAPLAPGTDETTARLVCTELAWLHLTPLGDGRALLQAMVPGPAARPTELLETLLAGSALAPALRHAPRAAVALPAAPRLHRTPAVPGRILVGAGAIRYDPLSGTGSAQALRTAILAAASIHAMATGAPRGPLCTHYTSRLRRAFRGHLATCAQLYPQAFASPSWQYEIDACRRQPPLLRGVGDPAN
ncbi:NAD(P)/FAD-dependent oxidoreductase [Streptomyces sp. NPDC006463]|uniref:NAD(P)/FAD-dependent oxidoreductase n=1 Tax=Streptomyces sp. NPDC006463 TaxID=3364746 RepID=UPI003685C197